MGFLVSPGVEINEIDLTNVIPAVSTSIGGIVGQFRWGHVNEIVTIGSEKELAAEFQKPTTSIYEQYFTAKGFLNCLAKLLTSIVAVFTCLMLSLIYHLLHNQFLYWVFLLQLSI